MSEEAPFELVSFSDLYEPETALIIASPARGRTEEGFRGERGPSPHEVESASFLP